MNVPTKEMMTEKYKTVGEVQENECPKGCKNCLTCEYKYPCKLHRAYKGWNGEPVCIAVVHGKPVLTVRTGC